MIKKCLIIIISLFLFGKVFAFDIRNINKSDIVSQASYKVNDTNLVDGENAENILDNVKDLNEALSEKKKKYKIIIKIGANLNLKEQKIFTMIFPQALFSLVIEKIINLREWDQV